MKTLKVELFGSARRLAQTKQVVLEVGDDDTYRDLAAALAERFPALLGQVVQPHTYDLIDPYFFNEAARRVIHDLAEIPSADKSLLLFFVDAGG